MAISLIGGFGYSDSNSLLSTSISPTGSNSGVSDAIVADASNGMTSMSGIAGNNSSLSSAVLQALSQINGGGDISSLFSSDSQDSTSDFMTNLFSSLPGFSSGGTSLTDPLSSLFGNSSNQSVAPVALDQSSTTIKLQTSIQNLITQLDGNSDTEALLGISPDSDSSSSLQNLQQSFNSLITSSGGNPSQTSLQSFLKIAAANI